MAIDGAAPLRVTVVTETYPPEVNGVALTLARVVEGLFERGHDVQLVRPRQPTDSGGTIETGGAQPDGAPTGAAPAVNALLVGGMPIPLYSHLRLGFPCTRRLVQRWRHRRPDVVHVATEGPLGRSAVMAAMSLDIPVTSDFRTNFHAYSLHYGLGWLRGPILGYLRRFHNRTATTMVPTEALRRQLHDSGFRNLAVVSRGVDVGRFEPARRSEVLRARWGAAASDLVVLYVGRLAAEKNLAQLVTSFRAIEAVQPTAKLLLVGEGPMRASLQAQLPGAVFAGQRHGEDLAAHYASADLFLFPSLTETFGNVTAEAMASGLPVVAYDYAAAAQLMRPGLSGVPVACDNPAQFKRAAVALAGSATTRRQLGAQARADALAFGWPQVLARFEQVLRQAVAGPPPAESQTMSGVSAACSTT
jgi:glycosyltransferase involved in cell wall biosynthesis